MSAMLQASPAATLRLEPSLVVDSLRSLAAHFIASLPRVVLAIILLLIFYGVGTGVRQVIRRAASRWGEERTLELAVGRLVQAGIILLGILVSATAAFPSFTPADLVSTLGVGGVAIGFAFKDIFQNFLAGVLILATKPFHVGDQIIFGAYEGTVEQIQTRATYIKTYDGRRVIIPNSDLYTGAVTVNTAFHTRRMQYDIGIGYGDDIEKAKAVVLGVLQKVKGVLPDPVADVIVVELADSTVVLRARWWSDSRMADVLVAQDRVLTQIKGELTAAGIDLPFPTHQILLHNQTEDTDGDRQRQREGWPAGTGPTPLPRSRDVQPREGTDAGG